MKKVKSGKLTAGMLSRNFKESVKSFVATDEAYSFMNTIKGTPAYWKRFLFEVLAMLKQLGLPTCSVDCQERLVATGKDQGRCERPVTPGKTGISVKPLNDLTVLDFLLNMIMFCLL